MGFSSLRNSDSPMVSGLSSRWLCAKDLLTGLSSRRMGPGFFRNGSLLGAS